MSSHLVRNEGKECGPGAGIPRAPLPRCLWGQDSPRRARLHGGAQPPPESPWERMRTGSGGFWFGIQRQGNVTAKCNLISVAVVNQCRDQVLCLP